MAATLVRELVAQVPRSLFGWCVYCGQPCYGRTCRAHRDLLQLDPYYDVSRRLAS